MSGPVTTQGAADSLTANTQSDASNLADAITAQTRAPSVSAPVSAVNGAYDRVFRAIQRGGATPSEALDQAQKLGTFGMLADTSQPLADFARTVADAPGQGGQIAKDALDLRQSGEMAQGQYTTRPASQRIADSLGSSLGVSGSEYPAATEELLASQKAAAGPAYAKAYKAPPVPLTDLQDYSQSPMFQNAYDRARAISQKDLVTLPDGSSQLMMLPEQMPDQLDWRTLDLMKQGMEDGIREGRVQGIGANDRRATTGFVNRFVGTLDGLNPDYATARAAFAGPAKMLDALDAGRAYMGEDAPAIGTALSSLTPSEQSMYRVGALQAERDRLGAVPDTYNAAMRAGVNTPNRLAKLQQLFPDQASYGQYADMLGNENTMYATRARVLGGSQTSRNLSGVEDAGNDPLEMIQAAGELHHNPVGGSLRLLGGLMKAGNGQKMNEDTANSAAAILFNTNPNAFPGFAAGLSDAAKRAALAKALGGTAAPAASAAAAHLADALQQPRQ